LMRRPHLHLGPQRFRLSPSNLNYGLGCHRCFAEALHGEVLPRQPFPGLFAKLDAQQKRFFVGKSAGVLDAGLPAGVVRPGGRVASAAACFGEVELWVAGSMDATVDFADGTVGVVDFKTTSPRAGLAEAYRGQLNAYAWALRHPAQGEPVQVSRLGLLVVSHQELVATPAGLVNTVGTTWMDVVDDPAWFEGLLGEIAELAASPELAPSNPECGWCALLAA
jgi:hypothetical protein